MVSRIDWTINRKWGCQYDEAERRGRGLTDFAEAVQELVV
jgi:hypothetical protein